MSTSEASALSDRAVDWPGVTLARRGATPLGAPCRVGVPLPQGVAAEAEEFGLCSASGEPIALQASVLARWPDETVRWLLCEWIHNGHDRPKLQLAAPDAPSPATPVVVQQDGQGQVTVRRGDSAWRFAERGDLWGQPTNAAAVQSVVRLHDGRPLEVRCDRVEVLAAGPVRAAVRVFGELVSSDGPTGLELIAESHFFADTALRRATLTLRNRRRAAHPGGIWELGDQGSALIDELALAIAPPDGGLRWRCELEEGRPPLEAQRELSVVQASSGGERWDSSNQVDRGGSVSLPWRGYRAAADGNCVEGRRTQPLAVAESDSGAALAVCVEKFWQNFPKSLRCDERGARVGLFPADAGAPHELQGGEQKTHTVWIAEDAAAATAIRQAAQSAPLALRPAEAAAAGAVRFLTPAVDEEHAGYRALVDHAIDGESSFFAKREAIDEYGWRHFGDVYGDHEAAFHQGESPLVSHWNNQYDLVFGLGVRYLRTGDARWFELMEDMARHVVDIDIYHTDEDKAAYNHGLFWHTVHYVDAGKANHRSYPAGTVGGGPCAEHAYARGLLLHYCLTGEAASRDAVVELADWVLAMEDGSKTPFRWLAGGPTGLSSSSGTPDYHGPGRGPGNASETLLTAFELTGDRKYLERVEELMRRVIHPRDDHDALNLLDAETRWYYNLYLQALGRCLEIKHERGEHDENFAYGRESLLHYARWMADHEYPYLAKPEILEYPTETWSAQDMRKSEVFHFAARHAEGAERERFLERARYFYEHSVKELSQTPAARYCRPIALLLGCGFSYEGIRHEALVLESGCATHVSTRKWPFTPQKKMAIRRAKLLFAATGAFVLAAALVSMSLAMIWLRRSN